MKAVVYTKYGSPDVLEVREMPKPEPAENQVRIKVAASSANAGDWHLLRGKPAPVRLFAGLTKPKFTILGTDLAGRVDAVGSKVTRFKEGDEVYGDISGAGFGAFAEYACAPAEMLALKPANLSFRQAAAVPAASVTALQGLRDTGGIQAGQRVLINGASGGVGSFAVQLAKALGAEVTAVCSTGNLERMRSIGADRVIDYTDEDFTRSGQKWDLILAANGYHPICDYRRALSPAGRYVMSGGSMRQFSQVMLFGSLLSLFSKKKMGNMLVRPNGNDLDFVRELIEAGKVFPLLDREYSLSEVPEAIRYLEAGHAKGKVVITVAEEEQR